MVGSDAAARDPRAPDFLQNPFPFYDWLRRRGGIWFDEMNGIYFVGSYDLAQEIFSDHDLFTNDIDRPAMRRGGIFDALKEIKDRCVAPAKTLTGNDNKPSHDSYRALVSHFFTPRVLAGFEPFIHAKTDALLDVIAARGAGEFVADFAVPLPIAVIGKYLGLGDYGEARLKGWSDAFADELGLLTTEARALEAAELILDSQRRMLEVVRQRREAPRDDIISHLAAARLDDGRPLDDAELISLLQQLLVAGNETTTNMLSAGARRLAADADLFATLKSEPGRLGDFIEELLRLESPIQGQFRRATRDCEVGGVALKKGALLHVRLASANRDEAVFGDAADGLRLVGRSKRPHLAFGLGMHFCVGAMLSRLEMKLAFKALLDRFEAMEPAVPDTALRYRSHFYHRGLASLPIRVTTAR